MDTEFVDLLERKLREGCPFYLQLTRAGSLFASGQLEPSLAQFFRRLEIIPGESRIFSYIDSHSDHESGGSVWFNRDDKSILNPQIFGRIDRLLLSSVNTIDYVGDVYPIVQVGPTHFEVDNDDFLVRRPLGERAAVAVERRAELEHAIIVNGEMARDPVETLGGIIHGFDENAQAVFQILTQLDKSASTPENRAGVAYRDFSKLERRLGTFIQEALSKEAAEKPIEKFFPDQALDNMRVASGFDYSLANYMDLVSIMMENWNLFSTSFSLSRGKVKKILSSLNYGARRNLAHPHKALQNNHSFPDTEIQKIREGLALVRRAHENFKAKPEITD